MHINTPPTAITPTTTGHPSPRSQNNVNAAQDAGNPTEKLLVDDGNVTIQSISGKQFDPHSNSEVSASRVQITTTYRSDKVHISVDKDNQLNAAINGKDYKLPLSADNKHHSLRVRTDGGDDHVSIDKRINIEIHIEGGDGDDLIYADGNTTTVQGGKGNDYIRLGRGHTVAFGGDGDDIMVAGSGNSVMSGGKGNDRLYAGTGPDNRLLFLNGDRGEDQLYAGHGTVVLNGGRGGDTLVGYGQTTFYTGEGADTVKSYNNGDRIYAKPSDTIENHGRAKVTQVEYAESGKKGLNAVGTKKFTEQTEDMIEQLRGSPVGQATLKRIDQLVDDSRNPIEIKKSEYIAVNSYNFRNEYRDKIPDAEYENHKYSPELGYIKDNKPGKVSTHPEITLTPDYFDKDFSSTPHIAFYHELAHAFNGGTGTFIPGEAVIKDASGTPLIEDGEPRTVANEEYQAVGLPTHTTPFDFDNDPRTPPTTTNPAPFTENALREEMGVPLRDRYDVDEAPLI